MQKAGKNGGWYGFHDLRQGFATVNAASMNLFELQSLMQHRSLTTTQGYVNIIDEYGQKSVCPFASMNQQSDQHRARS